MARWPVVAAAALVLAPCSTAYAGGYVGASASGLDRAVAAGRLSELEASEYRRALAQARAAAAVSSASSATLAPVLRDAAALAYAYDSPRALALFSTVRMNTRYAVRGGLPRADVRDDDGIVYRPFPGRGLRFHPLASFGALNAHAENGRYRRAIRLAYALLARGRPQGAGLVWESYFGWAGGTPPWTSGMTQAVAAQAFARVGLVEEARLAYRALADGLLVNLSAGPWVRIYHFNAAAVLNAQLQTAVSVAEYARLTGDAAAAQLARRLREAAKTLLPRFDTYFWSRYSLGGPEAELKYHQYVTSLLWRLGARTGDPYWGRWAARFRDYWRKPPALERRYRPAPVYPLPRDGFRDDAVIRFWLSKPATVTLRIAGTVRTLYLQPGVRQLTWSPGNRPPGRYAVRLTAVDRVGNRLTRTFRPVVVARDTTPPRLRARIAGGELRWRARDAGTPWLRLRVVLYRPGERRVLDLRRQPLVGRVRVPAGRGWGAAVVAADSSRNPRLLLLAPG
ncbi:MAG: hypothetical protein ICV64_12700 [Thermoleophilia bacterium]|nr:hypothetical protein [Thermoleophilia bacterium]